MDEIVRTVYILHLDGPPLLRVDMEVDASDNLDGFLGLFGGFSSALHTLVQELGHKEIKSISVGDGVLVYSYSDPLLFVVHSTEPKHEQFSKLLVKQVECEFLDNYEEIMKDENAYIMADIFKPFKSNITDIYRNLIKIYSNHPELLGFLPDFIPLPTLYDVLNMGFDLIKGYPKDTIKLVRTLDDYFKEDTDKEKVAITLGRYSGRMIAKERYQDELVIDSEKVLNMLNEISIVKFDSSKELFDFQLCPICRDRTSEKAMCEFFSGFIEGALDNPNISVKEITCKATGDSSCSFKLIRN